ncbi:MAG: AzlC family ABC transporter permease [Clostridiales bacterium]|nr:AzlC family ABC transporter permease [Clostridiales bacterium]
MNNHFVLFRRGAADGVPIGLGYLAVSFTFGIMASGAGLSVPQAVIMSAANITSAGQFAALGIIQAGSSFFEMAMTQFVINLRYCLMSCSLSQKLDPRLPLFHRLFVSYGVTDEIFGVSVSRPGTLDPFYSYGLMSVAIPGWVFGTFLGALSGDLLPARLLSALNVALYGMFLAIVIPPARENRVLAGVILVAMLFSLAFQHLPVLSSISSGFRIIILTVLIAGAAAFLFPRKEDTDHA